MISLSKEMFEVVFEGKSSANLEQGFIHRQIQQLYVQNIVVSKRKMLN